jgi:hypothetical protein
MPRPIFEFSLHSSSSDVPHRFGEPLLRYIEFVGPVLNFVRLQEADAASVLRTFVCEIVGHSVLRFDVKRILTEGLNSILLSNPEAGWPFRLTLKQYIGLFGP